MKGIERIYPEDDRYEGKTFAHHKARYELALGVRTPEGKALDMGCGAGYGTEMLRLAGYQTLGVDISQEAIDYARSHYPDNQFVVSPIQVIDWNQKYDLITFFEVLEHLDPEAGLRAIQGAGRALSQGGVFIMSIPRDINEANNGFHLSRWPFEVLCNTLYAEFKYTKVIGQDWDTAQFSEAGVKENDFYIAICKND